MIGVCRTNLIKSTQNITTKIHQISDLITTSKSSAFPNSKTFPSPKPQSAPTYFLPLLIPIPSEGSSVFLCVWGWGSCEPIASTNFSRYYIKMK